jgi:hypothetical protein
MSGVSGVSHSTASVPGTTLRTDGRRITDRHPAAAPPWLHYATTQTSYRRRPDRSGYSRAAPLSSLGDGAGGMFIARDTSTMSSYDRTHTQRQAIASPVTS